MAQKYNKFVRSFRSGQGSTYECNSCGRRTRETGSGESELDMCVHCFEASGLANDMSDNGYGRDSEYYAEWKALIYKCRELGGKPDSSEWFLSEDNYKLHEDLAITLDGFTPEPTKVTKKAVEKEDIELTPSQRKKINKVISAFRKTEIGEAAAAGTTIGSVRVKLLPTDDGAIRMDVNVRGSTWRTTSLIVKRGGAIIVAGATMRSISGDLIFNDIALLKVTAKWLGGYVVK